MEEKGPLVALAAPLRDAVFRLFDNSHFSIQISGLPCRPNGSIINRINDLPQETLMKLVKRSEGGRTTVNLQLE